MKQLRSSLGIVIVAIVSLSCTGRASTALEEAFSIALNTSNVSIGPGQSAQVVGTIHRGPAKGDLTLVVDEQVPGISTSVSTLSNVSVGARGSITFSTAATVAPGTYQFSIRASATAVTSATTFMLTVR